VPLCSASVMIFGLLVLIKIPCLLSPGTLLPYGTVTRGKLTWPFLRALCCSVMIRLVPTPFCCLVLYGFVLVALLSLDFWFSCTRASNVLDLAVVGFTLLVLVT
jgi:hypothetical protein